MICFISVFLISAVVKLCNLLKISFPPFHFSLFYKKMKLLKITILSCIAQFSLWQFFCHYIVCALSVIRACTGQAHSQGEGDPIKILSPINFQITIALIHLNTSWPPEKSFEPLEAIPPFPSAPCVATGLPVGSFMNLESWWIWINHFKAFTLAISYSDHGKVLNLLACSADMS